MVPGGSFFTAGERRRSRPGAGRERRAAGHDRAAWTDRLLRARAVLCAGLVLGVGAAVTLANWYDTDGAHGAFTAGRFDIVAATDGSTFTDHTAPGAAASLTFSPGADAAALSPGTTVYALLSVKTANPSGAGTVRLTAGAYPAGTLADYLTYGVRTVGAAQCASAADYAAAGSAVVIADGSPLGTSATASQTVAQNGGSPVNYCFAITMPASAGEGAQGLSVTPIWQFVATSN
ncbi:SipW-dependent-type signal peptide-containing protein [Microbacterium capsulatum]|uniref:SipW-dependent-type signal peptide-containing protein n=1 Tax=Microbacterium capsulatum TaxID=3041921 RepID=A0ABU0XGU1_9MICO|nr:SipW-dependent-type signal peptide-containing protein [Microbacterium sp. ASV81]MDQ4214336.1 SipW-dependent-type signal peptide-containing protein [Microbacterium sp. ASV81]